MDYKQTIAITLLAGSVAAGGGAAGTYAVKQHEARQEVKIEATVKVDETKLAKGISENIIKHNDSEKDYQLALAKRNGCYKNRDNEYYLRDHCKGVSF